MQHNEGERKTVYTLYSDGEDRISYCSGDTVKKIMARPDVFTNITWSPREDTARTVHGATKEAAEYFGRKGWSVPEGTRDGAWSFEVFEAYNTGLFESVRYDYKESHTHVNPVFGSLWQEEWEYVEGDWEIADDKLLALIPLNAEAIAFAIDGGISKI